VRKGRVSAWVGADSLRALFDETACVMGLALRFTDSVLFTRRRLSAYRCLLARCCLLARRLLTCRRLFARCGLRAHCCCLLARRRLIACCSLLAYGLIPSHLPAGRTTWCSLLFGPRFAAAQYLFARFCLFARGPRAAWCLLSRGWLVASGGCSVARCSQVERVMPGIFGKAEALWRVGCALGWAFHDARALRMLVGIARRRRRIGSAPRRRF
jgi:hypothetical protein